MKSQLHEGIAQLMFWGAVCGIPAAIFILIREFRAKGRSKSIFLLVTASIFFIWPFIYFPRVAGNFAGGGGSNHDLLDHIIAGQPTKLNFTFSVWGAGSGDLSKRYTKILMHYRKTGEIEFLSIPVRIISSDQKHMAVEFIIPPQEISDESSLLEFYFDFLFDGVQNTRPHETVPITKPVQPSGRANSRPGGRSRLTLSVRHEVNDEDVLGSRECCLHDAVRVEPAGISER